MIKNHHQLDSDYGLQLETEKKIIEEFQHTEIPLAPCKQSSKVPVLAVGNNIQTIGQTKNLSLKYISITYALLSLVINIPVHRRVQKISDTHLVQQKCFTTGLRINQIKQ